MPPEETVKISSNGSGAIYKPKPRFQNRYLTQASYRKLDIVEILDAGNDAAHSFLARARWHHLPEGEQQCPYCARRGAHYFYAGRRLWKCRNTDCGRQFTVFSGTILHSTKLEPVKLLSIAIHFMEAKDSISAREVSGLHKLNHVPVHVLLLKFGLGACRRRGWEFLRSDFRLLDLPGNTPVSTSGPTYRGVNIGRPPRAWRGPHDHMMLWCARASNRQFERSRDRTRQRVESKTTGKFMHRFCLLIIG
jgi:transposase-like protein